MKFSVVLFALFLTACTACTSCSSLPAPKNADGSINPSVAVAEGEHAYKNATVYATSYVTACHGDRTIIGCNDSVIAQIKTANDKALDALFAAESAVRALPPDATTGADQAIADMNAALKVLQDLTPKH